MNIYLATNNYFFKVRIFKVLIFLCPPFFCVAPCKHEPWGKGTSTYTWYAIVWLQWSSSIKKVVGRDSIHSSVDRRDVRDYIKDSQPCEFCAARKVVMGQNAMAHHNTFFREPLKITIHPSFHQWWLGKWRSKTGNKWASKTTCQKCDVYVRNMYQQIIK